MKSPLARKIFGTDGVKQVFFGSDFVTVTKDDDFRWAVLKPDILAAIADHMASGRSRNLKLVFTLHHTCYSNACFGLLLFVA